MKTADLIDDDLDMYVAMALGHKVVVTKKYGTEVHDGKTGTMIEKTDYSTDWAHGGPIIELEGISVLQWQWQHDEKWMAGYSVQAVDGHVYDEYDSDAATIEGDFMQTGPTALIAAMRSFVCKVYGEEVADIKGRDI